MYINLHRPAQYQPKLKHWILKSQARSTMPLKFFTAVFGCWRDRARFLTFTGIFII
jgi:hypothetical protein